MHTQYRPSKFAVKNNIPYITTPHGMLQPWYLLNKRLKKKLYLELLLKNILMKSSILHAITPFEKESLYQLTKHKNIVEIPNFIHHLGIPKNLIYQPEDEYLLNLGRIHSGKGLDILLEAFTKIDNKKIKLKIVGAENDYSSILKAMIAKLNIAYRIEFVGSVYGLDKYKLFANAKAFIAPSYSEVIGMVNLEAAACKTPVITTYNTGISPEWNNNGGIMINPNVTELVKAINTITSCNDAERNQRGSMLSDFVIKNYSWEEKGHLWNDLYNSL
jgi:glycosyltransferase involved in cell wall biosynthesis